MHEGMMAANTVGLMAVGLVADATNVSAHLISSHLTRAHRRGYEERLHRTALGARMDSIKNSRWSTFPHLHELR